LLFVAARFRVAAFLIATLGRIALCRIALPALAALAGSAGGAAVGGHVGRARGGALGQQLAEDVAEELGALARAQPAVLGGRAQAAEETLDAFVLVVLLQERLQPRLERLAGLEQLAGLARGAAVGLARIAQRADLGREGIDVRAQRGHVGGATLRGLFVGGAG